MQKLKEFENYMALQLYYFKNSIVETKRDAAKEFKELYKNAVGESIIYFYFQTHLRLFL